MTLYNLKHKLQDQGVTFVEIYANDWKYEAYSSLFSDTPLAQMRGGMFADMFAALIADEFDTSDVLDWLIENSEDGKKLKVLISCPEPHDYLITYYSLENQERQAFQYIYNVTIDKVIQICNKLNEKYSNADNLLHYDYERV